MATQQRLQELWDYNPETDQITWKYTDRKRIKGDVVDMSVRRTRIDTIKYTTLLLKSLFLTGVYKQYTEISSTITYEELVDVLEYNSLTGIFKWKENRKFTAKIGSIAGCTKDDGYVVITLGKHQYYAHRLAWLYTYKVWPTEFIDHIDRNPTNNSISNLRDVDRSTNKRNTTISSRNISGYTGVCYTPDGWKSSITNRGEKFFLGYFTTPELASEAYEKFKVEHNI
jgi:hypothetical protein